MEWSLSVEFAPEEQLGIQRSTVVHAPFGQRTAGTHLRQPQLVEGVVEHGDQRGRELGFPTANVVIDDKVASDGVWAGTVDVEGEMYVAVVSVGRRATFYGGMESVRSRLTCSTSPAISTAVGSP